MDTQKIMTEIYTVIEVESMDKMQEMLKLPEMIKLRTEAGVDLIHKNLFYLRVETKIV